MHVPHALKCYLRIHGIQGRQPTKPNFVFIIVHMPTLKITKDIQVFNGMAQYYQCFIKGFAFITMAFITKLLWKPNFFEWITECQKAWEAIKQCHMDAPILISPHGDLEFYVHTYTYNLMVRDMLAQNLIEKCDQLIAYASQLFNHVEWNYITTKREALAMVYALHKFRHYLLINQFIFYVDHMALLYLISLHWDLEFTFFNLVGTLCWHKILSKNATN
jgi:hypothetical protein